MTELLFKISNPWGFAKRGVPLRVSIPLPQGVVGEPDNDLAVVVDGDEWPAQWRVLSRWPDNSTAFALLDVAADLHHAVNAK